MKPWSSKPWVRGVLVTALTATVLAGCASSPPPPPVDPTVGADEFDAAMQDVFGYTLDEADEHGISPTVIEILEAARERGRISFADLEEAVNDTLACFDGLGVTWQRLGGTDQFGLPGLTYTFHAPAGVDPLSMEWMPAADACQTGSMIVEYLYDNQPLSIASQAWFTEHQRPVVTACLVERGVAVSEGADIEWFMQATKDLLDATGDDTCLMLMFR